MNIICGANFTQQYSCSRLQLIGWHVEIYRLADGKQNENSIEYTIERPQLMCDYPLNLSILIRGGKETKWDSLSSGERNGKSPARRVVGLTAY